MHVCFIVHTQAITAFGARSLAAQLQAVGHETSLIIMEMPFDQKLEEELLQQIWQRVSLLNPGLIGNSIISTEYSDHASTVTSYLKKRTDTPIIWGGIHPTVKPEECILEADMISLGEAEETLVDLVDRMDAGQPWDDTPGIWVRKADGEIIRNPVRLPPHNLDDIPPPDFYRIESHFVVDEGSLKPMDDELFAKHAGITFTILTGRGCPFKCNYCYNDAFQTTFKIKKPVRNNSVDRVIEELLAIRKRFPFFTQIGVCDDSFLSRPKRELIDFSAKYKEKIQIPLAVHGIAPTSVTEEKVATLVEGGAILFRMGIQSGSPRTQEFYRRKNSTNERILKATRIIHKYRGERLPPVYDIILENPWEDDEDLAHTIRLLAAIPVPYRLRQFALTFYPGTHLYDKALEEKFEIDNLMNYSRGMTPTFRNRGIKLIGKMAFLELAVPAWLLRALTSRSLAKINNQFILDAIYLFLSLPMVTHPNYWKQLYWQGLERRGSGWTWKRQLEARN
jgi:anaerobic magnesium-protoporphyrin IX monomethyl ester cyclase